jgi:hypothetical protein
VSGRILALDPFARGLTSRGRVQRVLNARTVAASRLQRCQMLAAGDEQIATQLNGLSMRLQATGTTRSVTLQRDPERTDQLLNLVFEIEALPAEVCGDATSDDRALQLLADQRNPTAR